jgi:hypothetical protein
VPTATTKRWLSGLLVLGVILVTAWGLSLRALQNAWVAQAERITAAHDDGHSVLDFPLRAANELIGGRARQVLDSHFDRDGLELRLAAGPANVALGFNGACLDATLFPQLSLDHVSDQPFLLALVHSPLAGGEQRLSELELPAGSHRLRLDLRGLEWRADGRSVTLGDDNGRICEFRLVPVVARAGSLRLANVRFSAISAQALVDADLIRPIELRGRNPATLLRERAQLRQHADIAVLPTSRLPGPFGGPTMGFALALAAGGLLLIRRRPRAATLLALAAPLVLMAENLLPGPHPVRSILVVLTSLAALVLLGWPRRAVAPGTAPAWDWRAAIGGAAAWRSALLVAAVVGLLAFGAGFAFGPARLGWPAADDVLRYLVWAATQQWLLQRVLAPQLNAERSDLPGYLPAASAFALLHLPNFELVVLCLFAALWWIGHFRRHQAWLPLIIVHAVLGLALPELLPPDWLHSTEVGFRYFGPN